MAASQKLLKKHKIDWYGGKENLVSAPKNFSHSDDYAEDVLALLKAADKNGRDKVISTLREIGRKIQDGTF